MRYEFPVPTMLLTGRRGSPKEPKITTFIETAPRTGGGVNWAVNFFDSTGGFHLTDPEGALWEARMVS